MIVLPVKVKMSELIYLLVATHITIICVTVYLHRGQAHKGLTFNPILEHFMRFWLWLTTGMVTKQWVAIHRKHHRYSDMRGDPHSPHVFGIWNVLFKGAMLYHEASKDKDMVDTYGVGTPSDWLEFHVYTPHSRLGIGILFLFNLIVFGWIGVLLWGIQMIWIPFWAAGVINGLAHWWGYRNYEVKDTSRNLLPLAVWIGGEELHNNHHTYGTSAKLSSKWYEFDIGWLYISLLSFFGLAKVKKVAPAPRFDRDKLVADLDTLQSIVANRYDVMAKYARSLRQVWGDEIANIRAKSDLEKKVLKSSKKLLQCEPASLEKAEQQQLSEIFKYSDTLKTMHEMRTELAILWERSHSSSDQLLDQLRDWCARAEASGIRSLQQFSLRLRSYA